MSLKQLEYEIAADSFKYADNVSLEDSEKDYSVEEVNFDSQDVENKEDKPEPEKKEVQTESVNKNFRLIFAYYKDLNGEELLSRRDEIVLSAQMKICKEKASLILNGLNSKQNNDQSNSNNDLLRSRAKLKVIQNRALKIKEKFIKSNLRFVIDLANRYQTRGLPLSDLIQEGNIGLMKAVEKFDHTKGFKFSTYSAWWIHQSLSRAIMEQTKTISIPVYLQEQSSVVYKAKAKIEHNRDKPAEIEEIAMEVGISNEVVKTILRGKDMTVPLEISGIDQDSKTFLDIVPDPKSKKADYYLAQNSMMQRVKRSLRQLTDRERDVLKMRFGIDYQEEHKLEQIAGKYGLSRERIRQIETIALKKIADSKEALVLKEFLT
jgi:RNA polymerase sigma factor (sigma-70 family)